MLLQGQHPALEIMQYLFGFRRFCQISHWDILLIHQVQRSVKSAEKYIVNFPAVSLNKKMGEINRRQYPDQPAWQTLIYPGPDRNNIMPSYGILIASKGCLRRVLPTTQICSL